MKNTQEDIKWITAVLDHDIDELKETLEAVQALRLDEERTITRSDLAAAKREAQAKLLERVKNLAEYAYKVCVRRNETYVSESAKVSNAEPVNPMPSSSDVDWVPFTVDIQCESAEVARAIYQRQGNILTFTLEDFTRPGDSGASWKLYRAVFESKPNNDRFGYMDSETFYGWFRFPIDKPMAWRKDGVVGMIENVPCIINEMYITENGEKTYLSVSALLPFRPEY